MFHTVLTLGNWGKSSNASRSSDPNQAPPLATLQTDRTTCARMMGTRGIENGESKVMMQVDDHSVTELCARKKRTATAAANDFLQERICLLHIWNSQHWWECLATWCSGLMQAITPDVLEQCRALVQQYVAKGTCGRCNCFFKAWKGVLGEGMLQSVAQFLHIPSTHMHKSHYLPWCVLYMGVSTSEYYS